MPPTTTTTKATPSASMPMKGSAPRMGAASTPAMAAVAAPSANTRLKMRNTLMPSSDTISVDSLPARTALPRRVPSSTHHRPTASTAVKPITNSRYLG